MYTPSKIQIIVVGNRSVLERWKVEKETVMKGGVEGNKKEAL